MSTVVAVSIDDPAATGPLATVTTLVTLRPGQARAVAVRLKWPTDLSATTYGLTATVTANGVLAVGGPVGTQVATATVRSVAAARRSSVPR